MAGPRRRSRRRVLRPYRSRLDFRRSPEPHHDAPGRPRFRKRNPIFVIQEHGASTHHFDLRIECEGVLKSWAIPKGPSTDPREKRLAVRVEDHPLSHADFEGVIPEHAHGAGPVIVWDAGPYRSLRRDAAGRELSVAESIADGRIEIWLEGQKLRGGHALVRSPLGGRPDSWLLIKLQDAEADARRRPLRTQRESVLSGRTLEQVAGEDR